MLVSHHRLQRLYTASEVRLLHFIGLFDFLSLNVVWLVDPPLWSALLIAAFIVIFVPILVYFRR